jgi:hypothetical protein
MHPKRWQKYRWHYSLHSANRSHPPYASAYTEGSLLYGQWTYEFNDGHLVVTYPEGQQYLYKPVTFNSINLVADEKFEKDDDLVGVWKSTDTEETY